MLERKTLIYAVCLIMMALMLANPAKSAHKIIGVVFSGDLPRYRDAHKAFLKAMAAKGYAQGDIDYVVQTPNPDPGSWANAGRKMNAIGANVVVAYGATAALAVVREAEKTALVFVDVFGPQETGVIRKMFGDGGLITGVTSKVPLVTVIKTAQELRPIKKLGVICNSKEPGSNAQHQELQRLSAKYGFSIKELYVSGAGWLEDPLSQLISQVDAIFVTECVAASKQFDRIVSKANSYYVPILSTMPGSSDHGALVALEINPAEQGQMAAEQVAKVLSGVSVGQMHVKVPTQIDLVINLKAAKALDIQVPFQVLSVATRVVK